MGCSGVAPRARRENRAHPNGGTEGSNPAPSSGQSTNHRFLRGGAASAVCYEPLPSKPAASVFFAASGHVVSLAVHFAAAAGIGLDHTGDNKSFTANQSWPLAPNRHPLE